MRLDIQIDQVRGLLEDEKFTERVTNRMSQDKDTQEDMSKQIAKSLEDDPGLSSKILMRALDDSVFRGKVASVLVEKLIDG